MVVARTRAAMDALVRMIAAREVSRQYLALAHQPWSGPAVREVEGAIGRDPRNRLRMAVVDLQRQPGKPARTTFEVLHSGPAGCWLRCTLHTGRTHQIRVHAASIGHPLLADLLYGGTRRRPISCRPCRPGGWATMARRTFCEEPAPAPVKHGCPRPGIVMIHRPPPH